MKIMVKAKTRAREEKVERVSQPTLGFNLSLGHGEELAVYKVAVKVAPINGRANEAIIKALAEYFDCAPSAIKLLSGQTVKQKVFEVSK